MKELQRQASPNIVIALAGNKADLATKRAVDFQVSGNPDQFCLSKSGKQLFAEVGEMVAVCECFGGEWKSRFLLLRMPGCHLKGVVACPSCALSQHLELVLVTYNECGE